MTTIEDKLKLFKNVVFEKVQSEKQKDIEQFENAKQERINSLNEEMDLKEKNVLNEIAKKANIKAQEVIAKEKLSRQHEILSLKESMLQEVIDALKVKAKDYTETEAYENNLVSSFENAVCNLPNGDYTVYLTQKDFDKHVDTLKKIGNEFKNGNIEFKSTGSDIIGGTILEDTTGRMRIDNSIMAKLIDNKDLIGLKVTKGLS